MYECPTLFLSISFIYLSLFISVTIFFICHFICLVFMSTSPSLSPSPSFVLSLSRPLSHSVSIYLSFSLFLSCTFMLTHVVTKFHCEEKCYKYVTKTYCNEFMDLNLSIDTWIVCILLKVKSFRFISIIICIICFYVWTGMECI